MFWINFKIALRNLLIYTQASIVNIIGLSIGLCCFLIITLFVKNEMGFDQYFPKNHPIYYLQEKTETQSYGDFSVAYNIAPTLFEKHPGIKAYTRFINHSNFSSSFFSFITKNNEINRFYETNFYLADSSFSKFVHSNLLMEIAKMPSKR